MVALVNAMYKYSYRDLERENRGYRFQIIMFYFPRYVPDLPRGWKAHKAPNGHVFYHNVYNNESRWYDILSMCVICRAGVN